MNTFKKSKTQIQDEINNSVSALKSLISNKDLDSNPNIAKIRENFSSIIDDLAESSNDLMSVAKKKARKGMRATNKIAHSDPWPVVGAAVAIGALIGFLSSRR